MCRVSLYLHVCTSPSVSVVVGGLPGTPSSNLFYGWFRVCILSLGSVLLYNNHLEFLCHKYGFVYQADSTKCMSYHLPLAHEM